MKLIPFMNNTQQPMTVGGKTIMPGESRSVDPRFLSSYKVVAEPEAVVADFDIDAVLDLNLGELEDALPAFSDSELQQIKDAEEALEHPRKGAIQLLNVALLSRADAKD